MTYLKHAKVVDFARRELAAKVQEEPLGSNTGTRVRFYQSATWLGGTGWPWCVAFWVRAAIEAGFKLPYLGAGAYAFLDWARKVGWTIPLGSAVPGDAVVFNIGSGHMAILASPYKGGQVHTIDGNSSDRVKENWRNASLVRGIVHPPEKAVAVKPVKPPLFEVVTSESGHKVIYTSSASRIGKKLPKILQKYAKVTIRRKKK